MILYSNRHQDRRAAIQLSIPKIPVATVSNMQFVCDNFDGLPRLNLGNMLMNE